MRETDERSQSPRDGEGTYCIVARNRRQDTRQRAARSVRGRRA